MSCVLRFSGIEFDVDDYLAKTDWSGIKVRVYYKGERIFPNTRIKRESPSTGFDIEITEIQFEDFELQQKEVVSFLNKHHKQLLLLIDYPIDYWHCLDFGLSTYRSPGKASKTYILSEELCRLAGEIGIDIWMSNYFSADKNYLRRRAKKRWSVKKYMR